MVSTGAPVAQWLERPTRSRRVVGSNPIWNSDFFSESPLDAKTSCCISIKGSLGGWIIIIINLFFGTYKIYFTETT